MSERFFMKYLPEGEESKMILSYVFSRLHEEKTFSTVYSDGTVSSKEEFIRDVLRPGSLPFLVFWEGKEAAFCWLNSIEGRTARMHFVFFRSSWGRIISRDIGRCMLEYLLSLKDEHGFLFDVILGLTPQSNALAWKLSLDCGAVDVGIVPLGLFDSRIGHSVDARLVAITRESLGLEE